MGIDERVLEENMFTGLFGAALRRILLTINVHCYSCATDLTIEGALVGGSTGSEGVYCSSNKEEKPCYYGIDEDTLHFYVPTTLQKEAERLLNNEMKRVA